jgi:hypothetical protein
MGKSGKSKMHKKLMRGSQKAVSTSVATGQKLAPIDRVKRQSEGQNNKRSNEFDDQLYELQARSLAKGRKTVRLTNVPTVTLQPSILASSLGMREVSDGKSSATMRLCDALLDGETDTIGQTVCEPSGESVKAKSIRDLREQARGCGHHVNIFEGLDEDEDDDDASRYKLALQPSVLSFGGTRQPVYEEDDDDI